MKSSQLLDKFFEKRHKQWKKEVYAVFKSEIRLNEVLSTSKDPVSLKQRTIPSHRVVQKS